MHFKHLSLALLTIASAYADQLPAGRPRLTLPPLDDDALSLSSSRTQGSSSASTNGWDYVADNNEIKKMCTGNQRNHNKSLCNELELFYQAIRQAGIKAKAELRAAEQKSKPGTLRIDEIGDTISIVQTHTIEPRPELMDALQKIQATKQVTEEDLAEVMGIAPMLIFAHNAGSTRMEQKTIAGLLLMPMVIVQQLMAQQQQQTMPGRLPRG